MLRHLILVACARKKRRTNHNRIRSSAQIIANKLEALRIVVFRRAVFVRIVFFLVANVFGARFLAALRDFRFVALIFIDIVLDRFFGEIDRVFLDLARHEIVVRIALVFIEQIDQLVAFGDAGFRVQVRVCRIAVARSVRHSGELSSLPGAHHRQCHIGPDAVAGDLDHPVARTFCR